MPNDVTPVVNIQSSSPYHSVSYVDVLISSNPDDREVYRQGSIRVGSNWENTWSLSYVALSKLMNAAGIEEVANRRVDDRSHPFVCAWQFSAKWTQPDSTVLSYSGDYELDLRDDIDIGGGKFVKAARYEKACIDERQSVIEKKFSSEVGSLKGPAAQAKCDQIYAGLSEEQKREIDEIAEAKALRFVVQMRQFIVQRTQTGAMERAIRKMLNLKSQYTTAELKEPFRVPRSRFDWDRVDKVLGTTQTMELRRAQAMSLLGLTAADIYQARQLNAPRQEAYVEVPATQPAPFQFTDDPEEPTTPATDAIFHAAAQVMETTAVEVKARGENGSDDDGGFDLKQDEMAFRGKVVKKDEVIGAALQEPETKAWFTQNVVGSFEAPQHYKNHLKSHFGRESAVNLTYYEIDLLARHQINGAEYPAKYAGKTAEKKEVKPDKKPAKKKAEQSSNIKEFVEKVAEKIATEFGIFDKPDRASDISDAIRDVVGAVETGVIEKPDSEDGVKEIESFLREQLKK